MRLEKRRRWNIWVLGEADMDLVAESKGVVLIREEKEEVARL